MAPRLAAARACCAEETGQYRPSRSSTPTPRIRCDRLANLQQCRSPFRVGKQAEGSTKNERGRPVCRTFTQILSLAKVRHNFHTLTHFITTGHVSMEKMLYRFPFIPWHIPPRERYESLKFCLVRRFGRFSIIESKSVEPSAYLPRVL